MHEAFERIQGPTGSGSILLTCEHASDQLPSPWGEDAWLQPLHWAVDLGIAAFTRHLCQRLDSQAVLARFSRLWIDANRPLYSTTLFRSEADGRSVLMNNNLPDSERLARIVGWWQPFHDAVTAMASGTPTASMLLSMHSFTPVYEGAVREVEIGVLFDDEDALAARIAELLEPSGYCVRLNEPYSGKGGMMFSCYKHAKENGLAGIELEIRQDLLADPVHVERLLSAIEHAVVTAAGELA